MQRVNLIFKLRHSWLHLKAQNADSRNRGVIIFFEAYQFLKKCPKKILSYYEELLTQKKDMSCALKNKVHCLFMF